MAKKYLGRKVKHTKKIYRKRKTTAQKILSVIITVVILFGFGILGYSIGKPVMNFLKERKNSSSDSSSVVWTPPETTTSQQNSSSASGENKEPTNNNTSDSLTAFSLPTDALSNEQTLNTAISSAKTNGYTSVVVTLKAEGGNIYYATENKTAAAAKSVVGTLPLSTIIKAINDNKMTPIAEISVLKDNIVPRQNVAFSYVFEAQKSMWLDNKIENGGKAWLSPFADASKTYISELTNEIAKAGFKKIVAADLIFPPFRNSDLNYIGAIVKDPNRHTALTGMANEIKKQTDAVSGETLVKVSALEVLSGKSEVFVPSELNGVKFAVEIDPSQIPTSITLKDSTVVDTSAMTVPNKVKTILTKASEYAGSTALVPYIVKGGLSDADFKAVLGTLSDMGYKTYIIK